MSQSCASGSRAGLVAAGSQPKPSGLLPGAWRELALLSFFLDQGFLSVIFGLQEHGRGTTVMALQAFARPSGVRLRLKNPRRAASL